jgi:predicted transglutaminase-like protease
MSNIYASIYEDYCIEEAGFGLSVDHYKAASIFSTRKTKLLKQLSVYKSVKSLKSKNKKLYKKTLRSKILAKAMDLYKWEIPNFETDLVKKYVLNKFKQNQYLVDLPFYNIPIGHEKIKRFIQNHTSCKHPLFDPEFASKIHNIRFNNESLRR